MVLFSSYADWTCETAKKNRAELAWFREIRRVPTRILNPTPPECHRPQQGGSRNILKCTVEGFAEMIDGEGSPCFKERRGHNFHDPG
jgi:hypothetical protein